MDNDHAPAEKLIRRTPLEQGKDHRCQTAPEAKPRLVDQNQIVNGVNVTSHCST